MHIAIIGATAFILFVLMGVLLMSAVILEQRTRRRMAAAAAQIPGSVDVSPAPEAAEEEPKAMAAGAGR